MIDGGLITGILGLIATPIFKLIRQKLFKSKDESPVNTLNTLAATNPDKMDLYVNAHANLMLALAKYYNRDISGTPSQWVIDLRAAIRPSFVVFSLLLMYTATIFHFAIAPSIDSLMGLAIGSWFGDRFK